MNLNIIDKSIINYINKFVIKSKYNKYFNFTYHTQKYKLINILPFIFLILEKNIDWRSLKIFTSIHWNTIYKTFIKLSSFNIIKNTYIDLLHKYIKRSPSKKLYVQLTDTSSIINRYGINDVSYNKYKSRKKISKISFISDVNGIPLSVSINNGRNDANILMDHINNMLIDKQINDKYKKYFLADSIYDVKKVKNQLQQLKYEPIIPQNKKNIRNPKLIIKIDDTYKKIYKKRITIEYMFGRIKKSYKMLLMRYDKISNNYLNFLYLALIEIINSKL